MTPRISDCDSTSSPVGGGMGRAKSRPPTAWRGFGAGWRMWASRRDLGPEKKRMREDSRSTLCIELRLGIDQTRYCSINRSGRRVEPRQKEG